MASERLDIWIEELLPSFHFQSLLTLLHITDGYQGHRGLFVLFQVVRHTLTTGHSSNKENQTTLTFTSTDNFAKPACFFKPGFLEWTRWGFSLVCLGHWLDNLFTIQTESVASFVSPRSVPLPAAQSLHALQQESIVRMCFWSPLGILLVLLLCRMCRQVDECGHWYHDNSLHQSLSVQKAPSSLNWWKSQTRLQMTDFTVLFSKCQISQATEDRWHTKTLGPSTAVDLDFIARRLAKSKTGLQSELWIFEQSSCGCRYF